MLPCIVKKGNMTLGLLIRSLQAGGGSQKFHTGAIVAAYCAKRAIGARILQYCVERGGQVTHGSHRAHSTQIPHLADGAFDHEF